MDTIAAIKEQVSIYAVLAMYNVDFIGGCFKEQINCPFHGADINKSARVYPETNTLFCFTCDKQYDVIEFVKAKEEISFGKACSLLIKTFNVSVHMEDYEKQLYSYMKPSKDIGNFKDVVEKLFREYLNNLTNVQFYDKIEYVNKCWTIKDLLDKKGVTADKYVEWLNISRNFIKGCLDNE